MGGDARAGLLPLFRGLEQEFSDRATWQTLNEVEKRAVLQSSAAATVSLAAGEVLSDIGCPEQAGGSAHLAQQSAFLPRQGQSGCFANPGCLSHEIV